MDYSDFDLPKCVGCGYCCISVPCFLSAKLYGSVDRCPALKWNGSRYICLLAPVYGDQFFVGLGCPSSLNTWRQNVRKRKNINDND